MLQNSLQIFIGRGFVALNIEIWHSGMNLNNVKPRKESFKYIPRAWFVRDYT